MNQRPAYSTAGPILVALVWGLAATGAWPASGQELIAPVEPRLADPHGLPRTAAPAELPQGDLVLLAGGAAEFVAPPGWRATEIPRHRELRCWLTPDAPSAHVEPQDGIWMCFHWHGSRLAVDDLAAWLAKRTGAGSGAPPRQTTISGWPALVQTVDAAERREYRLAAAVGPAVFEYVVTARPAAYAPLRPVADRLLASIKLRAPQIEGADVDRSVTPARKAIGLWKSENGLLRLAADGRIVVQFDRKRHYPLDETGLRRFDDPVSRLTGRFQAEHDLITVTWDDGSQLNFRWTLDDGALLLTDHHGRVSQLQRLIE